MEGTNFKSNFRRSILFILIFLGIALIIRYIRDDSLNKNSVETKAVVTEFYSIRFITYYKYNFEVNGIKYEGSDRRNPNSNEIAIGDTIIILYDRTNPKNNKPISLYPYDDSATTTGSVR